MNIERLRKSLKQHEGRRLSPYKDSVGVLTIGYGRNLEAVGISEDEAELMLDNDMRRAYEAARVLVPVFGLLSEPRQEAIVEMIFNLGAAGFGKFSKMLSALNRHEYDVAADEALLSKWAEQVGSRATKLAEMLRVG